MSEAEIIEGFLCPICMKDLGTVLYLQSHFEEEHTAEDKVVFRQIKGLFDKAKRRILGEKDSINYTDQTLASEGNRDTTTGHEGAVFHHSFWEPQELGAMRSSIDYFKSIRSARVDDFVVKTNRLLIRLDKLIIADLPTDPVKRKAYEKSIVDWTPDSHVPLCPTCTKSFSITRRRHHCRLCGGIMCNKCSQFLEYSYAKKLTNPAFNFEGESGFRERSGSINSLNAFLNPEGEGHIRICMDCRKQLEKRDQITEQRQNKSVLVQLYDKMVSYITTANDMLAKYLPMVESLSQGDTRFDLQEAHLARRRLIKVYDSVDILSKGILTLGLKEEEPPSPKQVSLQRSIHTYASSFLKDNMLGLEELPSETEYMQLQTAHKEQINKKIAAERLAVMENEHKRQLSSGSAAKSTSNPGHHRSNSADVMGVGWQPAEGVTIGSKADDPMIQQMNIIRGYIKQARQARKMDEVTMLEQNLHELQQEYLKQSSH